VAIGGEESSRDVSDDACCDGGLTERMMLVALEICSGHNEIVPLIAAGA
jgi:hypothetical protein